MLKLSACTNLHLQMSFILELPAQRVHYGNHSHRYQLLAASQQSRCSSFRMSKSSAREDSPSNPGRESLRNRNMKQSTSSKTWNISNKNQDTRNLRQGARNKKHDTRHGKQETASQKQDTINRILCESRLDVSHLISEQESLKA